MGKKKRKPVKTETGQLRLGDGVLKLFFYQADTHFSAPEFFDLHDTWLSPEEVNARAPDDVHVELVSHPEQADFLVFPYWLHNPTTRIRPSGMRRFLASLPYFAEYQDRHVFATLYDSSCPLHISSVIFAGSVNRYDKDVRAFAFPFWVEDYGQRLHYDPERLLYHTSFVGYLHSWNRRAALLDGIRREARLKSLLDAVDRYHGHWETEEQRRERKRLFEDSLVNSLTVLCPRGSGQNSNRFFEAMSMGRIPILVSDTCELPFSDEIDYASFMLRIPESEIANAGSILYDWLQRHTFGQLLDRCRMARNVWERFFTRRASLQAALRCLARLKANEANQKCGRPSSHLHPIAQEETWLAHGFDVGVFGESGALEVNSVAGRLILGEISYLMDRARYLPIDAVLVETGSLGGLVAVLLAHGLIASHNFGACVYNVGEEKAADIPTAIKAGRVDSRSLSFEHTRVSHLIRPLPMPSTRAAIGFADHSVDLVFISDESGDLPAQLEVWYPKLRPGGVLCGRGCLPGSDVQRAVQAFTQHHALTYRVIAPPEAYHVFEIGPATPFPIQIQAPTMLSAVEPVPAGSVATTATETARSAQAEVSAVLSQVAEAYTQGKWKRVCKLLRQALELASAAALSSEEQATLCNSLGYAYMQRGEVERAEAAFLRGLDLQPQHLDLLVNLGNVALQSGRLERALGFLRQAEELSPDDVNVLSAIAQCLVQLGKPREALATYRKALAFAPQRHDVKQAILQLESRGPQ